MIAALFAVSIATTSMATKTTPKPDSTTSAGIKDDERIVVKYGFNDRCNNYALLGCSYAAAVGEDKVFITDTNTNKTYTQYTISSPPTLARHQQCIDSASLTT